MTAAVTLPDARRAIVEAWLTHGPDQLHRLVGEACPGPAGEPADMWLGEVGKGDGGGLHPQMFRIGTAQVPGHPHVTWPIAVPMLDDAHLRIATTAATQATAHHLVETLVMRVLSSLRPGLVNVHVWDAREVRGSLPGLYPLLPEGLLTPHDPTQLGDLLGKLEAHIAEVRSRVLIDGHRSLPDHAHATNDGVRTEPWTVVVLFGDRQPLERAEHAALQRVAQAALPAGISLITVDVPVTLPVAPERDVRIVLDGIHNRCSMTGPRVRLHVDVPLDRDDLSDAAAKIAKAYHDWLMREAPFRELLPAEFGRESSALSVKAPTGFSKLGAPVTAELGDATPHLLVGGPSGSGKTNALLAWLMALCARYSPDELALYLLDFKDGVSFAPLAGGPRGEGWLPHARLVGININNDREFGVALLRHLVEEMTRRATAFKRLGAPKLSELRSLDPDGRWPRIVAVVDEVQCLLEPRGDPVTNEAVALLEDLARRARSYGIHIVLASQNLAAVKALWAQPALLEQFSARWGLPRAKGVFADTNRVLLDLPRYHAVINAEGGEECGNVVARVPNACAPGTADQAQAEMYDHWGSEDNQPVLLDGDVSPVAHTLWTDTGSPHVTVGRGFTVDAAPAVAGFDAMPGRNLAVLGAGAGHDAPRVLSCAAAGLAGQGFKLGLVTFEALGSSHADWVAAHAPGARMIGHCSADEYAEPYLKELRAEITARLNGSPRPPRAVVIWEVDAAETRLSDEGRTLLREIVHLGPEVGVHVLGWWRSVDQFLKFLMVGTATAEDFGVVALCDVIGEGIGTAIPGGAARDWVPRDRRGSLYDRANPGRQLFMVPTLTTGDAA